MSYITKKAYIECLAARGILRSALMQKHAASILDPASVYDTPQKNSILDTDNAETRDTVGKTSDTATPSAVPDGVKPIKDPVKKFKLIKNVLENRLATKGNYLAYGLGGAAAGGALGAAIQAARGRQLLSGVLAGAGLGAGIGAGGKYLFDTKGVPALIRQQMQIMNSPEFQEAIKNSPELMQELTPPDETQPEAVTQPTLPEEEEY